MSNGLARKKDINFRPNFFNINYPLTIVICFTLTILVFKIFLSQSSAFPDCLSHFFCSQNETDYYLCFFFTGMYSLKVSIY